MKKIDKILIRFVLAFCAIPAFTVSCSDEPLPENYYTFTGEMVTDYLQNRSGEFSDFIAILQRSVWHDGSLRELYLFGSE